MASGTTAYLSNGNILILQDGSFGDTYLIEVTLEGYDLVWEGEQSSSDFQTKVDARLETLRLTDPSINIIADSLEELIPPDPPKKPPLTPSQIEEQRIAYIKDRNQKREIVSNEVIDKTSIIENSPDSLKPKGRSKLGQRLVNLGKSTLKLILPTLQGIISKYAIEEFQTAKKAATTPESIAALKEKFCPTPEALDNIIQTRNNIVDQLNKTSDKFNNIEVSINVGQGVVQTLQTTKDILKTTTQATQALAAIAPVANVLGPLTVTLNTLQTSIQNLEPKLTSGSFTIDALFPAVSLITEVIAKVIQILLKLDDLIKLCRPDAGLTNLNDNTLGIQQAYDRTLAAVDTYKGFTFEIETVPFTPTVNRYKALAINQSGVPLLESNLSFTSNPNTLINELKLIIDRDNLKAY